MKSNFTIFMIALFCSSNTIAQHYELDDQIDQDFIKVISNLHKERQRPFNYYTYLAEGYKQEENEKFSYLVSFYKQMAKKDKKILKESFSTSRPSTISLPFIFTLR